ncbi:MAG: preprotein translocase subunit SecG [Deltaproteobacteria bacterium]|nr:preprotein translocase subunit SecG [Deltaproteobacteria bacterium]
MTPLIIVIHIIVCLALILIVLLQTGKGADMGAAFGGSGQTIFGGAGPAPFLGKVTTAAAIVFMVTSLSLAYMSTNPFGGSIMDDSAPVAHQPVQEMPATAPITDVPLPEAAPAPAAQPPAE